MPERRYYRKTYSRSRTQKRKRGVFILKFLGLVALVLTFTIFFIFIYYAKDLPRPEKFTERYFVQSTKIYDRSGETLLYEIYGEEKSK